MTKRYWVVFLILGVQSLQAQITPSEYLISYKEAVQAYANLDYDGTIQRLTTLIKSEVSNDVSPYAYYYLALSNFHNASFFQSRETLRQLFNKYPDWPKMEEAYFLYTEANFKENYFEEALTYAERLTDSLLIVEVKKMEQHYLEELKSVNQLKTLNQKFPNNFLVAKYLVARIQERPYNSKEDLQLSDLLTNRFKLNDRDKSKEKKESKVTYKRIYDDESIDVGVLLPFSLKNSRGFTQNQFAYEFYKGMEIASKGMQEEGIAIRIFGIDVGTEETDLKTYLEDKNMAMMDVIVGPLYSRPNRLIESFCKKNKIIQVHPLSNNESLVHEEKYVFLSQPSNAIQARAALKNLPVGLERTCVIYFENTRKDSLFAATYAEQAKALGFKVLELKSIRENSPISLEKKEVGHVFFTGSNGFGLTVLRYLGKSKISGQIVANASSFDFQNISRGTLNKDIIFIYPEYVDPRKEMVKKFKEHYIEEMGGIPSYYAYLGYDLAKLFGLTLKEGKEIFRLNLNDIHLVDDFTLGGFDFSNQSQVNKTVPLLRWNSGFFEDLK